MKSFGTRLARYLRANEGQTLLIVVGVLAGIALTTLAVFLSLNAGQRTVERLKGSNNNQTQAVAALIAYYYQHSTLPCPDTSSTPSGSKATTCDGTSAAKANSGALPWTDLGLSRDQAVDPYGNYFTYVISTDAADICETVTGSYGAPSEYTGTLKLSSLKVQGASGNPTSTPFAIIGHGANGLGAVSSNNVGTSSPSSTNETTNCDRGSCGSQSLKMGQVSGTPLISGPFAGSTGGTAFDDAVYVPSVATLQKICQSKTPGGALNATMSDNFAKPASQLTNNAGASTGLDSTKYSAETNNVTRTNDATNPGNQVASFSGIGAVLATNTINYNFDPRPRPLYVSAIWTPDPGGSSSSTSGMSIVTRAAAQDQTSSSDDFNANGKHGITIRYYNSGAIDTVANGGGSNSIYIRNDAGQLAVSSTSFKLYLGKAYTIEAFDDGNYVWGRITQTDDDTNSAVVGPVNTTSDLDGPNQVALVGGSGTNYISNLTVGYGMLALETSGSGYVTTANLNFTGDLTAEAWIRPRALPASGALATILGSWDPSDTTLSDNAFRLSVSRTQLELDLSDGGATLNQSYTAGFTPTLNEWDHVAAVYDKSAKTVTFYVNGEQVGSTSSASAFSTTGVAAGTKPFLVGATTCGTSGTACTAPRDSFFTGDITDVRVWNTARSAPTILSDFSLRLSYSTAVSSLTLNWKFDRESGTFTGSNTTAKSTGSSSAHDGTLTGGASYIAALANYYRPFSMQVHDAAGNALSAACPSGTAAKSYECDFRANSQSITDGSFTFPSNLYSVYAKVWGGGGGAFKTSNLSGIGCTTTPGSTDNICASAGGGGGFSSGMLTQISATSIPGTALDIVVGGGGTGSTTFTSGSPGYGNGAGGGGASAVRLHTGTVPGLVAGGGGGASFSNDSLLGTASAFPYGCASAINDPMAQCGLGGPGGGAGTSTDTTSSSKARTARAADVGSSDCGGRGGDNTPSGSNPPSTPYCPGGGADPSSTTGGSGSGTASGGSSAAGAGGAGYDASAGEGGIGGGGGGGGISNSTFTAGGGEAGGHKFYGYDTVTISGSTFVSGDVVSITFTNGSLSGYPVTVSHTVGSSESATTIASALVTSINSNSTLQNDTYSGTSAAIYASNGSGVISLYQQSTIALSTQVTAQATTGSSTGTESVACTSPSNCKLNPNILMTISGPITAGDRLSLTFTDSKNCYVAFSTSAYVVQSGDSTTTIATGLAAQITSSVASHSDYTWFVSATHSSNTITITEQNQSPCNSSTTITPIIGSSATEVVTAGTTFFASSGDTSTGTVSTTATNGFGGGGGSGYKDTSAISTFAQSGVAYTAATVGTVTATHTVAIKFSNSSINFDGAGTTNRTVSVTVGATDNATTVAAKLASLINTDTQLAPLGVTATNSGTTVYIGQQRWFTLLTSYQSPFGTSTSVSSTGTDSVTFSPYQTTNTNTPLTSGYSGGFGDFYYSPSSYNSSYTPGKGGTSGGNGSSGAVLLFW